MTIVPDTKNWTWVLERRCPECGFVSSEVPTDQIATLIRGNARAWAELLAGDPEMLVRRVRDDRWSPLEYGCHVRDVFRIMDERLNLMATSDNPTFQNWDQDRSALDDRYETQDPKVVAVELSQAANTLADGFESVDATAWQRPGTRSNGSTFTIATLGQYTLHDVVHHLADVSELIAPAT